MDKQIACNFANVHNENNRLSSTTSSSDVQQPGKNGRPPLLRRVSQSDPHLDIPHFVNSQEKSFHHLLSGLFDSNSSFGLNKKSGTSTESVDKAIMPSAPNLTQSKTPQVGSLDRNKSALELSSADSEKPTGLRKSSSVANYNLFSRDTKESHISAPTHPDKTYLTPFSHIFGHGHSSSHTSHHNISTIPEDEGLMMSVCPTATTGISAASTLTSAAGGLMGDSSSAHSSSPPKSGISSLFARGFWAKPVIRSEEENYRYIMALDR